MFRNSNFIITTSFYPIKKSKSFFGGMYFDNPDTDDEIREVARELKKMNYEFRAPFPEEKNQVDEGVITLRYLFEQMKFANKEHPELVHFYEKNKEIEDIYIIFAKMSIIIRFDKVLEEKELKKQYSIFINPDMLPISNKEKEEMKRKQEAAKKMPIGLANINYQSAKKLVMMLKFLYNKKDYSNKFNFISELEERYNYLMYDTFIPFLQDIQEKSQKDYKFKNIIFDYMKIIEIIGESYKEEEFVFICERLLEGDNIKYKNEKGYLIVIISLIEMLLTHKPKYSEDSIKKQFVGKNKYIAYLNDKNIDLKKVEKELSIAYDLRSDIAHGNFDSLKKSEERLLEFYDLKKGEGFEYKDLDYIIETVSCEMEERLKQILYIFFKDKNELDLIKKI